LCGFVGGLVRSQIDLSSKGRSGEVSVGFHPSSIHHPINYADKEESLSFYQGIISISIIRCANSWPSWWCL